MQRHFVTIALVPVLALAAGDATRPLALGARRELFVDDFLIDALRGDARLVLHSPRVAEKAIAFDRPWEGVTSGYAVVWKEGERFRMYYRGASQSGYTITSMLRPGESVIPEHPVTTCYAESNDGIHWTKPSLALFDFKGSKENNIVWMGEGSENFSPFRDSNPRAPDSERYKAVASDRVGDTPVLAGFVSADGLHWKRLRPEPLLTDGKFDSLNVVFWDPLREQYVAVYRDFTDGVRTIKYAESKDFRTWSAGQWGDFGTAPMEHLYTNATVPYFRAPQIYLAFPRRFLPWRNFYPDAPSPGASDGVFMSSRDGLHWDRRFLESFIRPGTDPRNWVQRANTPARGVVPTGPDEISLYVERNRVFPTNYLERLVLRTDGFVSVHAGLAGGELVTKPFTFQGSQLMLNYATSAAGSIQLEVQDERGHPLPGFALEESPLIWGDQIDGGVSWRKPTSRTDPEPLKRLAGLPVRLRFVLKDADLYALQFR